MMAELMLWFPGNHICALIFVSCGNILFQDGSADFVCLCIFRGYFNLIVNGLSFNLNAPKHYLKIWNTRLACTDQNIVRILQLEIRN